MCWPWSFRYVLRNCASVSCLRPPEQVQAQGRLHGAGAATRHTPR